MIIYFTEEDLVSFGNYMVSKQRRDLYEAHPEPNGMSVEEHLSTVHDADLTNWAYLQSTYAQINKEITNEEKVIN